MQPISIRHSEEEQTFYAELEQGEGELAYSMPEDEIMDLAHTYVSENMRGQGVAEALVQAAVDYARQHGYKIIPTCPYVGLYVKRHANEVKDVLLRAEGLE